MNETKLIYMGSIEKLSHFKNKNDNAEANK